MFGRCLGGGVLAEVPLRNAVVEGHDPAIAGD